MSQATLRSIAFQGERGAYSEMAARGMISDLDPVPCATFEEVFESVASGRVDAGLLPIENTLAGSIHRNYDLLLRNELRIVGETQLRVEHCLIALPGVRLEDVHRVRSHPQALAQCEATLEELGVEVVAAQDTAGSVRALRDTGVRDEAAIASRLAAETYGLEVLREGIEDYYENYTRFLLLARDPAADCDGECKTSIVFALENKPGGLFRALACFALRDVDLTKIESRPFPGFPWKYRFYLDFIGRQDQPPGSLALAHLSEMTVELRVLGTYPRGIWLPDPE